MLLSHLTSLVIALAPTIAAASSTAAAASKSSSFPVPLQSAIPLCAQSCLQASLVEKFPAACTTQDGIQCLCSRYGSGGSSLGELALSCVYSSCDSNDASQNAASAYNICFGQKSAVLPTQTALTIVASTAPATTSPFSSSTATAIITKANQTQSSPSQAASVDVVSIIPRPTSTSTPLPAIPVTAPESPPKMSPAQIAGLSIAAVAAFILAVGLMALSICLRRRKERKAPHSPDGTDEDSDSKWQSARVSNYVPMFNNPVPPAPIRPQLEKKKKYSPGVGLPHEHPASMWTKPTKQRLGVGTSKNSSNSSLPNSQIGLAITAELDGTSAASSKPSLVLPKAQKLNQNQSNPTLSVRPISDMTRNTVFEEDGFQAYRTSSILLPTPPAAVAPIRSLQPSKQRPPLKANGRQVPRRSELFLSIPPAYERPQPKRILPMEQPSNNLHNIPENKQRPRLAPPIHMTTSSSLESKANTASSREPSNNGDILDYYLATYQGSSPHVGHGQIVRSKESPKTIQIKPKKSLSIVSQTRSPASSNYRDSLSSQTSFETADPNDPTPEDEDDDKQLSDDNDHVSPLEQSPISNLTYPKIPRASNQLVPRSPRSPKKNNVYDQRQNSRKAFQPAALLQKRQHELPPLLLETRPCLKSSKREQYQSPPRRQPSHARSISLESWTMTPASKVERQSKVQSGYWGISPIMYEEDMVRPLNVRRHGKDGEMKQVAAGKDVRFQSFTSDGLNSPTWVPRLTPTPKGKDMFISVGWSGSTGM